MANLTLGWLWVVPPTPLLENVIPALLETLTAFSGLLIIYVAALFLFGQFTLPTHSLIERVLAARQVFLCTLGWHGPMGFAREGKLDQVGGELNYSWPGVILVDPQTGLAFEPRFMPSQFRLPFTAPPSDARIRTSGLVFTGFYERIHSVISLRRQFRFLSDTPPISGYTADGIKISTAFFSIFSVYQPADVLRVTHLGPNIDDLRIVQINNRTGRIDAFFDNLDRDDRQQVHREMGI